MFHRRQLSTTSRSLKSKAGFTIVELLIYMGLFGGFLVLLSGLFVSTLEVQQESLDTARIEQDSHFILTRLQYDLGQATSIITPASNGETTSTLVLGTVAGNLTYFVEDDQLKQTVGGETNVMTGSEVEVTNLQFQRLGGNTGNPSLQIQLGLQSTEAATSHQEQRNYIYTVGLR